jgi:hypothetical protein
VPADALRVIRRRLSVFEHEKRQLVFEVGDGALEQRRLAYTRR